jgi:hypothetical protein
MSRLYRICRIKVPDMNLSINTQPVAVKNVRFSTPQKPEQQTPKSTPTPLSPAQQQRTASPIVSSSPHTPTIKNAPIYGIFHSLNPITIIACKNPNALPRLLHPGLVTQGDVVPKECWPEQATEMEYTSIETSQDRKPITLKGHQWDAKEPSDTTLIVVHGHGVSGSNCITLAEKFDSDMNIVIPTLRAHGENSAVTDSKGALLPCSMGVHEANELVGIVRYAKEHQRDKAEKLIVAVHSMMAFSMMISHATLSKEDSEFLAKNIDGILIDGPFLKSDITENWRMQQALHSFKAPVAKKVTEKYYSGEVQAYLKWPKNIQEYDALEIFKNSPFSHIPIAYVHGKNDKTNLFKHFERAQQELETNHPNIEFAELNDEHCGEFTHNGKTYRVMLKDEDTYVPVMKCLRERIEKARP